jgi:hypothetical protein
MICVLFLISGSLESGDRHLSRVHVAVHPMMIELLGWEASAKQPAVNEAIVNGQACEPYTTHKLGTTLASTFP